MARCLDPDDYTVAWIAILRVEAKAALAVLDHRHDGHFLTLPGDDYLYIGGDINGSNVVIAQLPAGQNPGIGAAAALANQVKLRFYNIRFALLVGIAAGCPNLGTSDASRYRDIRLGDVLVCVPDKAATGIEHYDLGQDTNEGFFANGRQTEAPPIVRSAIRMIQLEHDYTYREGDVFEKDLKTLLAKPGGEEFAYPGAEHDKLFPSTESTGTSAQPISRPARDGANRTQIWYGNIGSGNSLMKNAKRRDELRDKYNLIGLEMEAAGVMNSLSTGVIRGVCDYGDEYKNDKWQGYAAAVAAVYAKAVVRQIPVRNVQMPVVLASDTNWFSRAALIENTNGHYWKHLSIASFTMYDEIWKKLSTSHGQAINFNALAQCLKSTTTTRNFTITISESQIRKVWDLLLAAWTTYESIELPNPDLAVFPNNLIFAALYMIHMEKQFPFEVPNSIREPSIEISSERWNLLTRFNQWVSCACPKFRKEDCGLEWNFARGKNDPLSRRQSSLRASVAGTKACLIESSSSTTTFKSLFKQIDPQRVFRKNRDTFFARAFKQTPRIAEGP